MRKLPRIRFAHLPTPVDSLPRLSAKLGGIHLSVKHDDETGLAFGGNKTRKLEFLIADAQANGARTLITTGAVQSNHCRQTAAAAVRYGFECILVLAGEAQEKPDGNLLLDHLLGVEIVWCSPDRRDETLQAVFDEAWSAGRRPYLIPYGGSNEIGVAAYVEAMREYLSQGDPADTIVFASSSGGTQAGLVLGARLFNYPGRVVGISVDEPEAVLRERVAALAERCAGHLDERHSFSPQEILVQDGYISAGYGNPGAGEREAIDMFAREEGMLLDPVYTGRAAWGLIDLLRNGFFHSGERILFWHTGGTPALFAARYREFLAL